MKKFLIGCAIVVAALVVLVVVVILIAAALGYFTYSSYSRASSEREADIIRRHAFEPARAASLPPHGTFAIFSGSQATKMSDDGRTVLDSETGDFFVDLDSPRLTLLEEPAGEPTGAVIARFQRTTGDVNVRADGTIRPAVLAPSIDPHLGRLSFRSPDGVWLARVDAERFESGAALIFVKAESGEERVVRRDLPAKAGYTLFWSPDSKKLFLYQYDPGVDHTPGRTPFGNTIFVTTPDSKELKKVYATPAAENDYLGPMLYAPSIDKILLTPANRIEAIDATTGATSTLWTSPDADAIGYATLSPDGTKVAVPQNFEIRVVDVSTGKLVGKIAPGGGRRTGSGFAFFPSSDRILFTAGGNDDVFSHADYRNMTSWTVANAYLYVAKIDGTDVRQIGDESVSLDLDGVISR